MIPKRMQAGCKQFYVGSNNLTADWTKKTLKDAVAHGQRLIDQQGYEEVFVVKIVKVLRRQKTPVKVEDFRG